MTQNEFPNFLQGSLKSITGKLKSAAKVWARAYSESAGFPEPPLIAVPDGTVVVCSESVDFRREMPTWRPYLLSLLLSEVCEVLEWRDMAQVSLAFERSVLRHPWGALALVIGHGFPNSIERVGMRCRSMLEGWARLDRLRYMDRRPASVSLDELAASHFAGLIAMWNDRPADNNRTNLLEAVSQMMSADAEEIRRRTIARLLFEVRQDVVLFSSSKLLDEGWLERGVSRLELADYSDLTTGYSPSLRRRLYILKDQE